MKLPGPTDLEVLMPMHLVLSADGQLVSMGTTLHRICRGATTFPECFLPGRSDHDTPDLVDLIKVLLQGKRVFLRLRAQPKIILRGCGIAWGQGLLLNLGFGNSLVHAVRVFGLTDSDFSPAELALELLFLHEANLAVQSELRRIQRQLVAARDVAEQEALTDPMTGLLNRRGLASAIEALIGSSEPFGLVQLDLDHFKDINDRYGHAAGDAVLIHVARVLRAETRPRDSVARLGGDEFVVLLAGIATREDLDNFKRRLEGSFAADMHHEGHALTVRASMGATLSIDYERPTLDRMMADADSRLYCVKASRSRGLRS